MVLVRTRTAESTESTNDEELPEGCWRRTQASGRDGTILHRCQTKLDGRTAYKNMRGKDYDKELVLFGEVCPLPSRDADR